MWKLSLLRTLMWAYDLNSRSGCWCFIDLTALFAVWSSPLELMINRSFWAMSSKCRLLWSMVTGSEPQGVGDGGEARRARIVSQETLKREEQCFIAELRKDRCNKWYCSISYLSDDLEFWYNWYAFSFEFHFLIYFYFKNRFFSIGIGEISVSKISVFLVCFSFFLC